MTTVVMYDEVTLSRWVEEAVRTAGITMIVGTTVTAVERDGSRLQSVRLAMRYGEEQLRAGGFGDASGDANLTWHAGLIDAPRY